MSLFPDVSALKEEYVGKSLVHIPTPAAVLDISKVKKNCTRMLGAVDALGFGWRAHVKTHKTLEATQLQAGEGSRPVNLAVSTVAEAESLVPLLLEYKDAGRQVNLLYAIPVAPSQALRLANLSRLLGAGSLSLLVDHPSQLKTVSRIHEVSQIPQHVFVKIDMGYHRAGVVPGSAAANQLLSAVIEAEQSGVCFWHGVYTHAGHSYGGDGPTAALGMLLSEIKALQSAVDSYKFMESRGQPFVLSVGATPTTTSVRRLLAGEASLSQAENSVISELKTTVETIASNYCTVEVHAGVHCILDIQQLATHALPLPAESDALETTLSWDDLALTVLTEVSSIYPSRDDLTADSNFTKDTEVLIAAGSLALGREPCKAYPGWGIVTSWNINDSSYDFPSNIGPENFTGWQVGRISQEHGILTWKGGNGVVELEPGQKLRIWPNHACITGAMFDYYLVIDSEDRTGQVIDVWPRLRGW